MACMLWNVKIRDFVKKAVLERWLVISNYNNTLLYLHVSCKVIDAVERSKANCLKLCSYHKSLKQKQIKK